MLGPASLERRSWPALDGSLREQGRVENVGGYIECMGQMFDIWDHCCVRLAEYIQDTVKSLVPSREYKTWDVSSMNK